MKRIWLFLLFNLPIVTVLAQAPQIDSLNKLLATTKEDTVKVAVLNKLSFYDPLFQHGLDLAEEALVLARKIKYEKGEADCLHQIGNQYWFISNYPMALHYYLEALKIRERINDKNGLAISYSGVGLINKEQGDYKNAIIYVQKALPMYAGDKYRFALNNAYMADAYAALKNQDSALMYYQRSYEYFILINDRYQLNHALDGLAGLQFSMGNMELALGYYRESIRNGNSYQDTLGLSYTYLRIAKLYDAGGSKDSAIYYAARSMFYAQRANGLKNVIESGKLLSKLYENKNDKEALHYLKISQAASDSLFSRERTMQIQNMLFNETERTKELAEKEKKDTAERKQNIQYALIAIGIITFIILFLLLSRSFITNTKVIEILGVIALLIVFEFLNLLLHPFLGRITHHSPVLMLLALVCIAAILVPLHHKLEKWATAKLVEKNKAIRLAKAQKTIRLLSDEKLEKS